jgi:redox-sensing transcriptional repressor
VPDAIPVPTLRRLPLYLRLLEEWRAEGRQTVSCTHISEALDLDPTQVRKDLAVCGVPGRPKVGYDLPDLADGVARFLGWDNPGEAFLIGAGPLGRALMAYEGFAERGLAIVAAFDPDPALVGTDICGKPVMPMAKLADLARRMHIRMGVLATPSAQIGRAHV